MQFFPWAALVSLLASQSTNAFNFPFESHQLTESDFGNNSDIVFASSTASTNSSRCKNYPGDADWPSEEKWNSFNASLGGALIKGIPPAAACYNGTYYDADKCTMVKKMQMSTIFTTADPVIPNGQWQLGNPCPVPQSSVSPPLSACNLTSFPAYVVNATSVKNIQLGVNFARNNNIRLTIKNTGHDFLGRNTGGGALQIWTHPLKALEYLPEYEMGQYSGKAAKVASGLEQFELHQYMEKYNMTILAPGSTTVGAYGGFMGGGGFSTVLTSKLGLMADQVLSFEIVTADGKFLHADPEENEDLFWAVRGGGPGNWGVVTSLIVKAYDTLPISQGLIGFQTFPLFINSTSTVQVSEEAFWKGVSVYFSWLPEITSAQGVGWNTLSGFTFNGTKSFTFNGRVNLGGWQKRDAETFMTPMLKDLNAVGINLTSPTVQFYPTYPQQAYVPGGPGEGASNSRFGSHLFPRSTFADATSAQFNASMAAIRSFVEDGGYSFHSVDYTPTEDVAGWPGTNSAVSPHLRRAMMHATGYDVHDSGPQWTAQQQIESHARLNAYVDKWRAAAPGSGAYMNEADTQEPGFRESFYGGNYGRLLGIKERVDPWDVFYVVTGVGSDRWYSEGVKGLPTQQGRLCRV
ncbi:FAD/FMN-containing isoamyl alcohol oxidase-like protein MreA [Lophiostoma macrostomum CBS 122681]|uniref:FAD/FMN-containing isoamyl alcohol oxidase-like protein MreA n=1 Tax=Lophiostoma macrostomum CBS 122681 TaxID=1314788 RepID=A0A6A6TRE1_9PLEO|nr:FAD/FMN-containing isoamyl alcohol oxidase-like protein MreA [Lophiostoma macrostomum CBS 122681]